MGLYNILDDRIIGQLYDEIPDLSLSIYHNNTARFMEFTIGFITGMAITRDTVLIEMRLEIPWAIDSDLIPIYTMHQIGFITNGSCLQLDLPKLVARFDEKFYNFHCSVTASGSCLTGSLTSKDIMCLNNGHNVTCPVTDCTCNPHCSYNLGRGLMITTTHKVYKVLYSGRKLAVDPINGSMFIPWDGLSHVDVARVESPHVGTFFPPQNMTDSVNVNVLPADIYFETASTFRMNMNISTMRSLEEDIILKTKDQDDLLNKMYLSKAHFGVLSGLGTMAILLVLFCLFLKFRPCQERLYCSWCNQRSIASTASTDGTDV